MLDHRNVSELVVLYQSYLRDPLNVEPAWRSVFDNLDTEARAYLDSLRMSTPIKNAIPSSSQQTEEALSIERLTRAYRTYGHRYAKVNPLAGKKSKDVYPDLELSAYGDVSESLCQVAEHLKDIYCQSIGFEYMHIENPEERAWLQQKVEDHSQRQQFDRDAKKRLLQDLQVASDFENYLHMKFPSAKRFGLEGGEGVIPALQEIIRVSANLGVEEVILGMAHRGRLNVLANVMGKPYHAIFAQFQGAKDYPDGIQASGDVKYHMGYETTRFINGKEIHLSLSPNPSHLEFVDPVVMGKVRGKQALKNDLQHERVMGLLIHGDAALAGQGIVAETLMLSQLPGYRVGGMMHIVINNQIGFTTSPQYSRSSQYCTDIAKMVQAPVFHVNGEDVEAVAYAAHLAARYRHQFHKDVFIDIKCYRRNGHNEIDEPSFTQPKMYAEIRRRLPVKDLYTKKLMDEGVLTPLEKEENDKGIKAIFDEAFAKADKWKPTQADILKGMWRDYEFVHTSLPSPETGVAQEDLTRIGTALTTLPDSMKFHDRLQRFFTQRKESLEQGENINWATAESLAFASLLEEGYPVRLSGQDSGRGTFSQRHAVLVDQATEQTFIPLNHIKKGQASFEVIDSPLSEAGVLGYEYGYTTAVPQTLVIWEAQFGDFTNGAQVIIDQFISAAETKWLSMSGLVMLLPHGYEGQGPEHSSARLERFLQQSAEFNWQVVYCTTPANHFHVLRRQMVRSFRKPLVAMAPKSLLRHRLAVSRLEDMTSGTRFQEVIPEIDQQITSDQVKRVVLCTGKIYYDLLEQRRQNQQMDVAIVRIEQLYPFPKDELLTILKPYAGAQFVWCQEEPENMGAWNFIDRYMEDVLHALKVSQGRLVLIARTASASTATGYASVHEETQKKLVTYALQVN